MNISENMLPKLEDIRAKYNNFIESCDTCEEKKYWDIDEMGQMESYFVNEVSCFLLRLIVSDGVGEIETAAYNNALGFEYDVDTLKSLYKDLKPSIEAVTPERLRENIDLLSKMPESFPLDQYKDFIRSVCGFVAESDGTVSALEKVFAEEFLKVLD